MVTLEPTQSADRRTKNRIREHGPHFTVLKHGRPQCFDRPSVLVRSPDRWDGWFPEDHVTIKEIEVWG